MTLHSFSRINISGRAFHLILCLLIIPAFVRAEVSDSVKGQITEILKVKSSFSAGEKKLSSNLAFAERKVQSKPLGKAANLAQTNVAGTDGLVKVVIRGNATPQLLADIANRGGKVDAVAPSKDRVDARMPLTQLEGLASRSDVGSIRQ